MTANFDRALTRGFGVVYALQIEGIPYIFTERRAERVDSFSDISTPSYGGTNPTEIAALVIKDTTSISQEINRGASVSGGKVVEFILNYDELGSYLPLIFRSPVNTTEITGDVTHATATNLDVEDTSGFASSGGVYLGKEFIRYTGVNTSTKIVNMVRGEINPKYEFSSSSFSTYRMVTDSPLVWRGRKVTLFEHLVTPDGYMLEEQWLLLTGGLVREVWQGFIDAVPIPDPIGMRLRCLPYQRLLSKPVGSTVTFDMAFNKHEAETWTHYEYRLVTFKEGDGINLWAKYDVDPSEEGYESGDTRHASIEINLYHKHWQSSGAGGSGGSYPPVVTTLGRANLSFGSTLSDQTWPVPFISGFLGYNSDEKEIWFDIGLVTVYPIVKGGVIVYDNGPDFLQPGMYYFSDLFQYGAQIGYRVRIPFRTHSTNNMLVVVYNMVGQGWSDTDPPDDGIGIIEADDNRKELVKFEVVGDAVAYGTTFLESNSVTVLKLTERGLGGTTIINLYDMSSGTLATGSGAVGPLTDVMLSLLESSGTTSARGTHDTLPLGFGYAIDSSDIYESSFDAPRFPNSDLDADCISEGNNSFDKMLGGWFATQGMCVVSRVQPYGYPDQGHQKLEAVSWHVITDPSAPTLTKSDVLMSGALAPKMLDGPNSVSITTSDLLSDAPETVVRDIPRIQAEGPRQVSFSCPSATVQMAYSVGAGYIYHSDGLSSIELHCVPSVSLQCGDNVLLELEHPAMYDWSSGSVMPASVSARVVRTETVLSTRAKKITFLMASNVFGGQWLCPSLTVISATNTPNYQFTVSADDAYYLNADDVVTIYNPGKEADGETDTWTIHADHATGATTVRTTASLDAWVDAGSVVTFPQYGSATTSQKQHAYARGDKRWTG